MHCIALLGKNITTQHYVINYIFYLQTIYSYPAHMIQNTFKIFGGNFFVYSKQHSDTLNCQLSLSKQQLNESSHYCLAHSNSSVKAQLLRCSHQIGSLNTLIGVSISPEEFLTGRLQNYKIQKKSWKWSGVDASWCKIQMHSILGHWSCHRKLHKLNSFIYQLLVIYLFSYLKQKWLQMDKN